jgi:hypothetical protein
MSTWGDIAGIVGKAAPIVGTLLGGPAGAAVGGLISAALGTSNDPDSVSAALAADPANMEKVIEVQTNAKVQLQQIQADLAKAEIAAKTAQYQAEATDRASARDLAAKQPNDFMRPLLGLVIVLATVVVSFLIISGRADSVITNTTAAITVGTVIGYLFGEAKSVLGFYFGMTAEGSQTNAAIRDFATSPGAVTTESGAPIKPISPGDAKKDLAQNWTNGG